MPNRKYRMPIKELSGGMVDSTISSLATKWGMVGGAITSAFGTLTSNGSVALIGILVTVLGFLINYTFQCRRERRDIEEATLKRSVVLAEEARRVELHAARLAAIKEKR